MENSEIRLLLLDFDGTLADTRRANTLSYVAALGEAGYTLTEEEYAANYFGMRCNEFLTRFGIADPAERERLRLRKIALYPTFFDTVRLNEPLWTFCRQFRAGGGRVWVVSTGSRANIDNVMRHLHLEAGVDGIISALDAPQRAGSPKRASTPAERTPQRRWAVSTAFSRAPMWSVRNPLRTVFWRPCAAKAARRARR